MIGLLLDISNSFLLQFGVVLKSYDYGVYSFTVSFEAVCNMVGVCGKVAKVTQSNCTPTSLSSFTVASVHSGADYPCRWVAFGA